MPAPIAEEMQPDLHLDQLEAVGKAFDALLLTLYRLTNRHNELKNYTEDVFKQVNISFSLLSFAFIPNTQPNVSNDEKIWLALDQ